MTCGTRASVASCESPQGGSSWGHLPSVSHLCCFADCDLRVNRPAGLHLLLCPGSLAVSQTSEAATVLPTPRYGLTWTGQVSPLRVDLLFVLFKILSCLAGVAQSLSVDP